MLLVKVAELQLVPVSSDHYNSSKAGGRLSLAFNAEPSRCADQPEGRAVLLVLLWRQELIGRQVLPLWEAAHRSHPICSASVKQNVCAVCLPADFHLFGKHLLEHKESPGPGLVSSRNLIKLQAPTTGDNSAPDSAVLPHSWSFAVIFAALDVACKGTATASASQSQQLLLDLPTHKQLVGIKISQT